MQAKLSNVITRDLVTVPLGTFLSVACEMMEQKKFRHLPVADGDGKVVGIISKRGLNYIRNPEKTPVEYVMASPVVTVDQNSPLRSAIFKMLELKISSLLISDKSGAIVGIVTTDDLLWYLSYILEDSKESRFSFSSLFDLQTIGEAAQQISNAGI
ncbi:MAG: CBS domain-containing protein [Bdellovibrionaceae bacterium]|nr:CBS domain-containing protein [Pseudobdellovibrionaceae bacterium]